MQSKEQLALSHKLLILIVVIFSLFSQNSHSYSGAPNGAWNVAGNWTPAQIPADGDTVIINSAAGTISNITTSPSLFRVTAAGSITLGDSLVVSDSVNILGTLAVAAQYLDVNGQLGGTGSLTVSSGELYVSGNWNMTSFSSGTSIVTFDGSGNSEMQSATTFHRLSLNKSLSTEQLFASSVIALTIDSALTVAVGTLTLNSASALTLSASGSGTDFFNMTSSSAILDIGGTDAFPSGFESVSLSSASTVQYSGASQTITHQETDGGTLTYGNLILSGSGIKLPSGAIDVNGDFSSSNVTFSGGSSSHSFGGNWTMTTGTLSINPGSVTIFDGPIQTLTESVSGSFDSLRVNGLGVLTLGAALNVAGMHVTNNTTLDVSANNYAITVTGNWLIDAGSSFNARSGSVTFNHTGDQSIASSTFFDVTFSGSGTKSLTGSMTVTDDIIINDVTLDAGAFTHIITDDWTFQNSAILSSTGTFSFEGAVLSDINLSNAINDTTQAKFYNLTVNKTGNNYVRINNGDTIRVSNQLRINDNSAFMLDDNGANVGHAIVNDLTVNGILYLYGLSNFPTVINNSVTYDASTGGLARVQYYTNADQIVDSLVNGAYDLILYNSNSTNFTYSLESDLRINDDVIVGHDGTNEFTVLDIGNRNFTITDGIAVQTGDTLKGTGTLTHDLLATEDGYINLIDANAVIDVNNVVFTVQSGATDNREVDVNINASNTFNINGTLTIQNPNGSASRIFELELGNSILTANGGSDQLTMSDHSWISSEATDNFENLIDEFETVTFNSNTGIAYVGNGDQTIAASYNAGLNNLSYYNLHIDDGNGGNAVKTAEAALDINGTFIGTNDVYFNDAGLTHTVAGDYALENPSTTAQMTGTIHLDGADQNVPNNFFNHVIFGGTGTKSNTGVSLIVPSRGGYLTENVVSGTWDIDGNVTVNDGVTVDAGDFAIQLAGNWSDTGTGSLNHAATTTINGTSDQVLSGNFYNLTLSNTTDTIWAGNNLDIANNITFSANSTFADSGKTVSVGNNWTRDAANTSYVATGTINFDGSSQFLNHDEGAAFRRFNNIHFSGSGTKTINDGYIYVAGDYTIDLGVTVDNNEHTDSIAGNFTNNGTITDIDNNLTTMVFSGADQNILAGTLRNATMGGTGTKTLTGDMILERDLTIESGVTLDVSASNYAITVKDEWTNNGTFNARNGTVTFSSNFDQDMNFGTTAFYNLIINKSADDVQLFDDLDVDNDLTITAGTLTATGFNIYIGGSYSNSGTLTQAATDTVYFDAAAGTYTINMGTTSITAVADFNVNSSAIYNLSSDAIFSGEVHITNGTYNLNQHSLSVTDSLLLNGSAALNVDASSTLALATHFAVGPSASFSLIGNVDSVATLSKTNAGTSYTMDVNGTIAARYYSIEYINNGLQLNGSATIDAINNFSDGSFNNGLGSQYITYTAESGAAGDRDSLKNVSFNAGPTNNISRTAGTDTLILFNYGGTLGGESFEEDSPDGSSSSGYLLWGRDGVTWNGSVSTNWHDDNNWTPSGVPMLGESVTIPNTGTDPIIDSTAVSGNVVIESGATLSITTTGTTGSLDVNGDVTIVGTFTVLSSNQINISGSFNNGGTFNPGSSTLVFDGSGTAETINTGGAGVALNRFIINGTGNWTLQAALNVDDSLNIRNGSLDVSAGNFAIQAGAHWTNSGTLISRNGEVYFDGTNQSINGTNNQFYDLRFNNSGTKTLNANIDINNDMTVDGDIVVFDAQSYNVSVGDDWLTSGTIINFRQSGSGTLSFDRSTADGNLQNIEATDTLNNVIFSGVEGKELLGNLKIKGNVTISVSNDYFDLNNDSIIGVSGSNTLTVNSGSQLRIGESNFPASFETINFDPTAIIYYIGFTNGPYTIETNGGTIEYGDLRLNSSTTYQPNGDLNAQRLYVQGTAFLDMDGTGSSYDVNIREAVFSVATNATIDLKSSVLTLAENNNTSFGIDADIDTVGSLVISGNNTKYLSDTLYVMDNVTIEPNNNLDMDDNETIINVNSGSFTAQSGALIRLADDFPNTFGTYSLDPTSTVRYDGADQQLVSTAFTYGNLEFDNGNTLSDTIKSSIDVNGYFSVFGDGSVFMQGDTLSVAGNWTISDATDGFYPDTSTVIFDGSSDQTLTSAGAGPLDFYNLVISGSGSKGLGGDDNYDIANNLIINPSATFDTNNEDVNVAGDYTNNGSYSQSGGSFTFDGANQTINPGSSAYNTVVMANTGTKTFSTNGMDVNFTFTINPAVTVDFAGLSHSFDDTWTNNGNPILNAGTFTFNDVTAQAITLNANDTLNNVIITNIQTKTISGPNPIVFTGDLTIAGSSTLSTNNVDIELAGSLQNSGTLTLGTGNISLNNSVAATYTFNSNNTAFNDLTINANPSAIYQMATSNATINGDFRIISGAFDLNGRNLQFGDNTADSIIVAASGRLTIDELSSLSMDGNTHLIGESGSTIQILGTVSNYANITSITPASDFYGINILSGATIEARYYNISNTDSILVNAGATLDATNNFSDGALSAGEAGGVYLVLNDALSANDTIRNISFGTGPTNNIARSTVSGFTYVIDAFSGVLGGAAFERDASNEIQWQAPSEITWTGNTSNDWNVASNWSSGSVPISTTSVIINSGGTQPRITSADAVALGVTVNSGASLVVENDYDLAIGNNGLTNSGAIIITGTDTVSVTGDFTVNSGATFSPGTASVIDFTAGGSTQNLTMTAGTLYGLRISNASSVTLGTSLTLSGPLSIEASSILDVSASNYAIDIAGDWTDNGSFTYRSATVTFDGVSATFTNGDFYDLTVSGSGTLTTAGTTTIAAHLVMTSGTLTAGGVIDVNGTDDSNSGNPSWQIQSGTTFNDGGFKHTVFAGVDIDGTYAGTGTLRFDSSNNGVDILNASSVANIEIAFAATSNAYLRGDITTNSVKVISGRLQTLAGNSITATGSTDTLIVSDGATIFVYDAMSGFEEILNEPTSLFYYYGADQTVRGGSYGNLYLYTAASTKTLAANIDVNGLLFINTNVTFDVDSTFNYQINLAGNFDHNQDGIFKARAGTVVLDGSGTQNIYMQVADTNHAFYNLTVSNTGRVEINDPTFILNNFSLSSGTADLNNNTLSIGGDFSNFGSFIVGGTSTVNFIPAASSTVSITSGGDDFDNVIFNSSSSTFNLQDAFEADDDVTVTAGRLDLNGQSAIFGDGADGHTINGVLDVDANSTLRFGNNSSFTVGASGQVNVVGTSGNPATVTRNTTGSYGFSVNGTIAARYYLFEYMNSSGIQVNATATIDATNNFSDGSFTNGTSGGTLFRIENTQTDTISNVSFPLNPGGGASNVTKTAALSGTITFSNVSGDFSGSVYENDANDLIIWPDLVTLTWDGSSGTDWNTAANWTASSGPAKVPDSSNVVIIPNTVNSPTISSGTARAFNITVNNSSSLTLNGGNIEIAGALTNNGNFTVTNATDSVFALGDWNNAGSFTAGTGTVFFLSGSSSSLSLGSSSFYNLQIDSSTVVQLGSNITVSNDLTIVSGTLNTSSNNYNITIAGDWVNQATFIPQSGTVTFNASSATQSINNGSSTFYDLIINASGATVQIVTNNLTVTNDMTLSAGTFDLNSNNLLFGDASGDNIIVSSGATLSVDANSELQMGSSTTLTVNSGGTISIRGSDASNRATVTRQSSGSYTFIVNGTIEAEYYLFEYMDASGLQINSGATVSSTYNFSNGIFSNGASGGRYLLLANNWSVIPADTIRSVTFNSGPNVNARRVTGTGPSIVFQDADGVLAGVANEDDSPDGGESTGRIHWDYTSTIATWVGGDAGGATDWENANNWNPASIPDTTVSVVIPNTANNPVISSTSAIALAADLTVNSGAVLTVQNNVDLIIKGTMTNAGTLTIASGSTSTLYVYNNWANSGSFTANSSLISMKKASGTATITSGGSAFNDFATDSTASFELADNMDVNGDITLNEGTLDVSSSNYQINLATNWTNSASFNARSGTLVLDGSSAQTIISGGTGANQGFYNITLNGAGDKTLSTNSLLVTNSVNFTSGDFVTTNTLLLEFSSTASFTNGNSNSFVRGPAVLNWTTSTASKSFPIGKASNYRPLTMNLTSPSSPRIRVEVFNGNPSGSVDGTLTRISRIRYYQFSVLSGSTNSGTIGIEYGSDDEVGGASYLNADLVVAQSGTSNGTYTSLGQTSIVSSVVTSTSFNATNGNFLVLGSVTTPEIDVVRVGGSSQSGNAGDTIFMATLQIDRRAGSSDASLTAVTVLNRLLSGTPDAADIDSVFILLDTNSDPNDGGTSSIAREVLSGASGGSSALSFNSPLTITTTSQYLHFYFLVSASATGADNAGFRIENSAAFTFATSSTIMSAFPITGSGDVTLPVDLVAGSFHANKVREGFEISAETASEDNLAYVILQRSTVDKDEVDLEENDWTSIRKIESSPDYIAFGRELPKTLDKIDTRDLKMLRYRIITEELNGKIITNIANNVITIDQSLLAIKDYELLQNYPNPFNPDTKIAFKVPFESKATVYIYNLLGQKVRTLFDNELFTAGKHERIWNGRNQFGNRVSSGMYFYQLIIPASNKVIVKKMILLK